MHRPEPPVPDGAEALEDRAVEDVGAHGDVGLKPKKITRMGVSSEPPPIPVSPTSTPIRNPLSVNCQVMAYER